MPGEDTLPKHKSLKSVTYADVQRLLNITLSGAGVVEGLTSRNQSSTTTLYGEYRNHHGKPFQKYIKLSRVPPHVFIPLAKPGLSMVSGYRPEAAEENKSLQQGIDECDYRTDLKSKYQNIARCLVRDAQPQSTWQQKRMATTSRSHLKGTSIARSRSVLRTRNRPTFSLPGNLKVKRTGRSLKN